MCVCMYICVCVCVYVYVHVCETLCVNVNVCVNLCTGMTQKYSTYLTLSSLHNVINIPRTSLQSQCSCASCLFVLCHCTFCCEHSYFVHVSLAQCTPPLYIRKQLEDRVDQFHPLDNPDLHRISLGKLCTEPSGRAQTQDRQVTGSIPIRKVCFSGAAFLC